MTFAHAEQMVMNSDVIALQTYSPAKLKTISKGLKALAVALPANSRAIGLTYRRDQPLTAAQRTFLEILDQRAAKLARAR